MRMGELQKPISLPKTAKGEFMLSSVERFTWWKQHYFMTMSIAAVILAIPMFQFYRLNPLSGVRISAYFYLVFLAFIWYTRFRTKAPDEDFLRQKGLWRQREAKWWHWPLRGIGYILTLYVIYITIKVIQLAS